MSNALVIVKKEDQDIPEGYLKRVNKYGPKSLGVMFVDKKAEKMTASNITDFANAADNIREMQGIIRNEVVFFCGQGSNNTQPFHILTVGDNHIVAAMCEGVFQGGKVKSSNLPIADAMRDVIHPHIAQLWELCDEDMDKFSEFLKKEANEKIIAGLINGAGTMTFMLRTGERWTWTRGKAMSEFDWGWVSSPEGYDASQDVPKQTLLGSVLDTVRPAAERAASAAEAIVAATKTASSVVAMKPAAQSTDLYPAVEGPFDKMFDYDKYIAKFPPESQGGPKRVTLVNSDKLDDKALRKVYHRLCHGWLPNRYKERVPVITDADARAWLKLSNAQPAEKSVSQVGKQKPAVAEQGQSKGVFAKLSDEELKKLSRDARIAYKAKLAEHEAEEEEKQAEEEERQAQEQREAEERKRKEKEIGAYEVPSRSSVREFVPILSAEQKESANKTFLKHLFDVDGNVLPYDPKNIPDVTSQIPSFCKQLGLGGITALFNLPLADFQTIAQEDPHMAAVIFNDLVQYSRRTWATRTSGTEKQQKVG